MDVCEFCLLFDESNIDHVYFEEILKQQGYFFRRLPLKNLDKSELLKILLIIGPIELTGKNEKKIADHIRSGNTILTIGEINGLEDILGITYRPLNIFPYPVGGTKRNSVGEGYFSLIHTDMFPEFDDNYFPLHGFGCFPIETDEAKIIAEYKVLSSDKIYPAITKNHYGDGLAIDFAINIVKTVRHIQEGRYIDQDGIPPDDGMTPIDDGILKCEDGMVLDWKMDRRKISDKFQVPAFIIPIVDVWKKILSNLIDYLADFSLTPIEKVAFWPENAEFVTMISHDTDGNNEKIAKKFLKHVNEMNIRTTWCLIPPGYKPKVCKEILKYGHELAFHFDAQSFNIPDIFSFETLKEQFEETLEHTQLTEFHSNKNHYTRWEKRIDFFLWLEKLGIKVDQSKGPSKCGTIGFPFGTAHPWQAIDNSGRLIDVLEICFQSQDLGLQGPNDIMKDIVNSVKSVNGIVHFIFHPAHYKKNEVQEKFKELVEYVRSLNTKFMRSIDISEWYRNRRAFIESKKGKNLENVVLLQRDNKLKRWIEE